MSGAEYWHPAYSFLYKCGIHLSPVAPGKCFFSMAQECLIKKFLLEKVEMGAETYCANVQETGTCLSIFALTTFILKHNLNTLNFFESSGMVYWRICSDLWILLVFLFCSVLFCQDDPQTLGRLKKNPTHTMEHYQCFHCISRVFGLIWPRYSRFIIP